MKKVYVVKSNQFSGVCLDSIWKSEKKAKKRAKKLELESPFSTWTAELKKISDLKKEKWESTLRKSRIRCKAEGYFPYPFDQTLTITMEAPDPVKGKPTVPTWIEGFPYVKGDFVEVTGLGVVKVISPE